MMDLTWQAWFVLSLIGVGVINMVAGALANVWITQGLAIIESWKMNEEMDVVFEKIQRYLERDLNIFERGQLLLDDRVNEIEHGILDTAARGPFLIGIHAFIRNTKWIVVMGLASAFLTLPFAIDGNEVPVLLMMVAVFANTESILNTVGVLFGAWRVRNNLNVIDARTKILHLIMVVEKRIELDDSLSTADKINIQQRALQEINNLMLIIDESSEYDYIEAARGSSEQE